MKAVVFHGVGDIRLDDVKEPKLEKDTDAMVRLTASAICGTDLHMIRGTMPDMKPGTILGHEGVGIVEEIGKDVRNLRKGDRVVIPSTIACGTCSYCRAGYFSQCDNANPNGAEAGTAFYGGPASSGPFDGMQAEYVRTPYAHVNLIKLPDEVEDDQAILMSDIFPTGYMAADIAEIQDGDTVAVFGCGPVGLFAIVSARLLGAGRVLAVDHHPSRLDLARQLGAETINFDEEDPLETIKRLTDKIGVDRAIDAVGVDAEHAHGGPAAKKAKKEEAEFEKEKDEIAPKQNPDGNLWQPGDAPSQVLNWAVDALAKAGTLSIIGVYPLTAKTFPIGKAMNKNLTIQMGNCHHRKYIPHLLPYVQSGVFDPASLLTQSTALNDVIAAYEAFDQREEGWVKVMLKPAA
ncbi:MAG TPA: zinc-dependent alcohol dehydrogenase [Thermoanaerobaculia bacterium]|jgi:threonine dehydrogenase-like Zn-dependent dehydrogenase|nr:zinc-dependent alcohol dehydrogenase [Thermoanaerobaculia bacterium]